MDAGGWLDPALTAPAPWRRIGPRSPKTSAPRRRPAHRPEPRGGPAADWHQRTNRRRPPGWERKAAPGGQRPQDAVAPEMDERTHAAGEEHEDQEQADAAAEHLE